MSAAVAAATTVEGNEGGCGIPTNPNSLLAYVLPLSLPSAASAPLLLCVLRGTIMVDQSILSFDEHGKTIPLKLGIGHGPSVDKNCSTLNNSNIIRFTSNITQKLFVFKYLIYFWRVNLDNYFVFLSLLIVRAYWFE